MYQIECFHIVTPFVVVVVVVINWTISKEKSRKISISLLKCKVRKLATNVNWARTCMPAPKVQLVLLKLFEFWMIFHLLVGCPSEVNALIFCDKITQQLYSFFLFFTEFVHCITDQSTTNHSDIHYPYPVSICDTRHAIDILTLNYWQLFRRKTLLLIAFRICFRMFYHIIKFTISKCFLK